MYTVGFIIRIYHDAQSLERQIRFNRLGHLHVVQKIQII